MTNTQHEEETTAHKSQMAIAEAREEISMFEDYKKLVEDKKFVKVIIEGYLQDHTNELFNELLHGDGEDDAKIMRKLDAVRGLTTYVQGLGERAQLAADRIKREQEFLAKNSEEV